MLNKPKNMMMFMYDLVITLESIIKTLQSQRMKYIYSSTVNYN